MSLSTRYGQWAVVAGASEGLGEAFARALAREGFCLLLLARRPGPLEALAVELRAGGATVETRAVDLSQVRPDTAWLAVFEEREVGLLVYNAALSVVGDFFDIDAEQHRQAVEVNALAPVVLAHRAGQAMRGRGRGGLLLMSSMTGFWGTGWVATYSATKAFNVALGEALVEECRGHGVDVLVCAAGPVSTPGFLRQTSHTTPPPAMTPQAVVEEALAALPRGGVLVPGRLNRVATWVLGLLPRAWATRVLASQTKALVKSGDLKAR